jgi:hypothetical protein
MSEQPIAGYKLSEFRAVPVGADTALVTYFADSKTPGDNVEHHMAVGEVWAKRNSQWLIRADSGTGRCRSRWERNSTTCGLRMPPGNHWR